MAFDFYNVICIGNITPYEEFPQIFLNKQIHNGDESNNPLMFILRRLERLTMSRKVFVNNYFINCVWYDKPGVFQGNRQTTATNQRSLRESSLALFQESKLRFKF